MRSTRCKPRYSAYAATTPTAPSASAEAAAVSAARQILIQLAPAQKSKIDEAYADSLARIPDGAAKNDGITLGEQVAASSRPIAATDATNVPDTYRPITTPGRVGADAAAAVPAIRAGEDRGGCTSADQFRPGPPPQLTSALYARDYNETKELGGAKSTKRTPQQTEAVHFWTQPNFGPVWKRGRAPAVRPRRGWTWPRTPGCSRCSHGVSPTPSSRDWDAKFHYNFWRPVTAIRNGDRTATTRPSATPAGRR